MKIGIDLKPFMSDSKYRGIGEYSRNLINEMMKNPENEFHFLNFYGKYENDPPLNDSAILHSYYTGPVINDGGEKQLFSDEKTEVILENYAKHFLNTSEIEVMLFTSPTEFGNLHKKEWFNSVLKVAILYDLIPLIFPEQCLFDAKIKADYGKSLEFLKGMDLLLAISQSAKDDAIKFLGIPEEKIKVIYAGIDTEFKKADEKTISDVKSKYNIENKYLLFAGGIDFKKNIYSIIESFSLLPKKEINLFHLVIVGKTNNDTINSFRNTAKKFGVDNKLICTGFVSKKELVSLYSGAELLVFPSLYEGFGLPVLEAMLCDALVLTSNNSSLKELATGYASIVNPKSVRSIAKGISETLDLPESDKKKRIKDANKFARGFTWERVSYKTIYHITDEFSKYQYNPNTKYEFTVNDKILKDIINLYINRFIMIKPSESKAIGRNLAQVEAQDFSTPANTNEVRIIFDITVVHEWFLAKYSTGIGRVCKKLIQNLSGFCDILPVVNINKEKLNFHAISMDNFNVNKNEITFFEGDIYLMPEIQIKGVQVDKNYPNVSFLKQKNIPCFAIVYDILPLLMPEFFERKTVAGFPGYIKELATRYDGILSDSRSVSDTIIEYIKTENLIGVTPKLKFGYFHLGFDSFNNESTTLEFVSKDVTKFFSTLENVYLMVGTIEPRKGHSLVLEAFEKRWGSGSNDKLCFIGNAGWDTNIFLDKVKNHPKFGENLAFYESASDEVLNYAYKNSSALIQASAGEGFGLPLIEAASHEIPIICSDIPVFHEICGDNAMYFKRTIPGITASLELFEKLLTNGENLDSSKIAYTTWKDSAKKIYNMIVLDKNWYAISDGNEETIYLEEGKQN